MAIRGAQGSGPVVRVLVFHGLHRLARHARAREAARSVEKPAASRPRLALASFEASLFRLPIAELLRVSVVGAFVELREARKRRAGTGAVRARLSARADDLELAAFGDRVFFLERFVQLGGKAAKKAAGTKERSMRTMLRDLSRARGG